MEQKKLLALTALTSFALAISACGKAPQTADSNLSLGSDSANIVDGKAVTASDSIAKSTVALVLNVEENGQKGQALCTGSLVSQDVVLTAAHCMEGAQSGAVVFGLNVKTAAAKKNYRQIDNVIIHPSYAANAQKNRNDLALVHFTGGLPAGYKAAALATSSSSLKNGMAVVLAGYGATGMVSGNPVGTAVLRKGSVTLSNATYSTDEILFEQANGVGACHGDSGGPAFATIGGKSVIIGITSTSATEAGGDTCQEGSLYENVSVFSSFIQKGIASLDSAQ